MSSTFYFIIALIILCYLWIKKCYRYWTDRGFLQENPTFPMGSFPTVGFKETEFETFDRCYKKFKGRAQAVGFYTLLTPALLLIDPELIKNIYVKEFSSFQSRGMYYNEEVDPMSANLLTLDGQKWKERRVKLTPMFSSGKIKMMFEIIDSIGDKLVNALENKLKESCNQDMRNWAQRFTADNIGNTAFGLECSCIEDENSQFMKYGRRMFDLTILEVFRFMICMAFPNIAKKLKFRFFTKEVADFFSDAFYQTFEYREKNNVQRNDFVSMVLELKDQFTKTQLAAESTLIFGGGYETSSTLISFTLYELALNPDMQQRLREEIIAGIEANDGKLTYEMLNDFKYLDMVISESLRKYPPIASGNRLCNKDYTIPGTNLVISKEINVQVNTYSLHHDPEYFPNPKKFDPERFNDENVKNIKPYTYAPFGFGPRICMGMRFGLLQSKLGVAKLISNFSFTPCEKTTIPMKFTTNNPFMAPQNGMILKIERI